MRTYNRFRQRELLKIFRKTNQPMRAKDLGEIIDESWHCIHPILVRLLDEGWLCSEGVQKKRVWWASNKKGWPRDGRGKSKVSHANLIPGVGLVSMVKRRWEIPYRPYHPIPVAKHALDEAWGWVPRSAYPCVDDENEMGSNSRDESRPEAA